MSAVPAETNWAGNYAYRARRIHRPETLEAVAVIVAAAERIGVLGSRHSFTDIADSDELLELGGIGGRVEVDAAAGTAAVPAMLTYAEAARQLQEAGVALPAMASLPHISIAGAVATATHGSGERFGNLATAVSGLELIGSDGETVALARGDAGFDGAVVGLGALGVITRVTLDVEPTYAVAQRVHLGLGWEPLLANFGAVMGAADSVSVFTRWTGTVEQVWLKRRVDADAGIEPPGSLFDATPALVDTHMLPGGDPANITPQCGAAGPWADRLPHFRAGFTPSAGAEIQSEYFVRRADAVAAIEALRGVGDRIRDVLQVTEIRTVAADRLWMSPQYERDSVGLHFTWQREPERVRDAARIVEATLAPFDPRPHWAKFFLADGARPADGYPRRGDFAALVERLDPRGAFTNAWLERHIL